ncbi:divalent metal cation transporter FieF [Gammaproteobacteria bacterium ESL0073]|nr:divalent metal cation transporter FieF [Gammaproteobacteria bacterium ESL0073]
MITTKQTTLIKMAAVASVTTAIVLLLIKAVAWWFSGSVSLLAGLADSALDSLASLLNLIAITIALRPADFNHRFGHGKAEALAGLAQSVFILISALFICWEGIKHLINPVTIENTHWGIVVMAFSLVVTLILVSFQRHVIKQTGSTAITADSLHYKTDILVNISILCALFLSLYGWQGFDAIFGILISFYILWSALEVGKEAVEILMDKELPKEVTEEMIRIAKSIPQVINVHDLKTRKSGTQWFIQLHVELASTMTLDEAHRHCIVVRKLLQERWPSSDVIIHADPR